MKKKSTKLKTGVLEIRSNIKERLTSGLQKGVDVAGLHIIKHTELTPENVKSLKELIHQGLLTKNDELALREFVKKTIRQSKDLSLQDLKEFSEIPLEYWKGMFFYRAKEWKQAEYHFSEAVKKNQLHAHSHFKLGMSLFKQKKWDLAFKYMSMAVSLNPEMLKWHVQLRQSEVRVRIQAQQEIRKSVRAKKQFDSQAQNDAEPTEASVENHRIHSAMAMDIEEQILIEKLEQSGDDAQTYAALAELQYRQNKLWQAIDSWNKAVSLKADDAQWFYQLGNACEQLGHHQQAISAYHRAIVLAKNRVPADWYYRLGYVYEVQGHDNQPDIENAQKYYNMAIAADRELQASKFGVGVFHAKRRFWRMASIAYQNQLDQWGEDAELYYRLGFVYDRSYQWDRAEWCFQKAVDLQENPDWRFRLGFAQERQHKYAQAAKNYQQAAESRKQYTPYWFYRAAYVLELQGFYEQATDCYLKLRKNGSLVTKFNQYDKVQLGRIIDVLKIKQEFDVSLAQTWFDIGNVYECLQDWTEAEYAYRQAVMRSTNLESLWYYRLGFVLSKQQKFKDACEALRSYRAMQRPHGVSEDILAKDAGFAEASVYSEYYAVLPVKKNTILYESFSGQGMSCNPYALFLYLFNSPKYRNWTHIWVINKAENIPDEYKKYHNIIFIPRGSDNYLRYLATTQYLINNSNFPPCFIRKPEQKFLSTWHGTPFKTLGRDMEGRFFEHKNLTRNILQSTHLLSPNAHTSQVLYDRHDIKEIYTGKLMEVGYPRIDMTIAQTELEKVSIRKRLGVGDNEYLIFYAPTWRGTHSDVDFDYEKLEFDLAKIRTLPSSKLVFRGHSLLQDALKEIDLDVMVAPDDLDTNKILGVADILITDYSSVLFDYLPTLKPLVLYMYDIEQYTKERGLYFGAEQLPGEKCYSIDELFVTLRRIIEKGVQKITFEKSGVTQFAPYDDGRVSERVVRAFFEDDDGDIKIVNQVPINKKSLLIYGGPFMGNGITTSVINLVSNIDPSKYVITLIIDPGSIEKEEGRLSQFTKLPSYVNVIARVGRMDMTLEDRYIHGLNNQDFGLDMNVARRVLNESWQQEYQRVFGNAKFDSLIQFEGYNRFWAGVFSSKVDDKRVSIFMHNSMEEEYRLKYPYLKAVFGYATLAHKVISVSELTMRLNQEKLAGPFGISVEKFDYADNLQQPELTKALANQSLLPEDEIYFGVGNTVFMTIGRLSVEKDHAKLIEAFSEVVKKYPASKLLIVGDGPLRHYLLQQIQTLSLQNNVHLLGLRANPFPLLKRADCFVLSSNHEGQPMTLFEAMILEKMIISTDIVGSRSALEGRSGHLVENSVQGLANGMSDFIEGRLSLRFFDIKDYQEQAIDRFSQIV